jgi:predicted CXXCH cytochrome family protein
LKEKMQKEKAHAPAARDCQRCHAPHASGQGTLLTQPVGSLCVECHDGKGASFARAHIGIPFTAMDCRNCHDPHASKDPKFFKEKLHAPFAGRACEECHIVEKR